ncbi:N-formylglutamate amidohydrolase [Aquincola sp. S2]|uniref:N-formylglutamate amidohydrolase n=1 Tax=Pseudaquabacterium terrae TaxID=2732868 RepID=A0ABX2ENR5_9BURK|nr:N-formylglutamate amidohydrolase [Aquabacterium terrae]NRF70263.1 N-formylglutamate amidohydrolase [Aquabacterium terrae]
MLPTPDPAAAFAVIGPTAPVHGPLVFDSPHSWPHWPADGTPTLATPAELATSWDAWVDELWAAAVAGRAPLLAARFHRAYIDANRARDDLDPALLAAPWPEPLHPAPTSQRGMGLIRRDVLPGVPMYAQPLPVDEVRGRLQRCYEPYHARLAALVDAAFARWGFSVHVDCHSMKSVGNAMNEDCGRPRPDLVVSDLDGRGADARLVAWVVENLRGLGYSVGINDPYRGGELVRRHGRPAAGRHSLQIEIKRSLYMDEARCERHAGFERLAADLGRFVHALDSALAGELGAVLKPIPSPPPGARA